MRRVIIEEPPSRAALWCRRWAISGLALAAIAIGLSRGGGVEPPTALAMLGAALGCGGLALLSALAAAVTIWRTGQPGIGRVLSGVALTTLLVAYPAWLAIRFRQVVAIADASTDWMHPPVFSSTLKAVTARRGATHPLPSETERNRQTHAYPDLRTLTIDLDAEDVYRTALKLVRSRHWSLVEAQEPTGRPATGHIEAFARSPVMGFPDDMVIRIVAVSSDQSRVDLRSASRFGRADIGDNVARLGAFGSDLDDAAAQ